MPSFLSESGPLIRAGPTRTHIEPDRTEFGLGPNCELCGGLTSLVIIGHL
jgi:hypothetical protein